MPDYLCCIRGNFVALELKRSENEKMEGTLQEYNLVRISKAGGYAIFVYPENFDRVKEELLKMLKGA